MTESRAAIRLRPRQVLRETLVVYIEHWPALFASAVAIFAPLSVLDALLEHWDVAVLTGVLQGLAQTAMHIFGDVLYQGIVAAAVIAWRGGRRRAQAGAILRVLPWRTILALDVILAVGSAVGLLLLVVPGVAFGTYFALAPSVAKIEHVGVRAALARSAQLVRGNFWRVLFVIVLVFVVGFAIEEAIQIPLHNFLGDAATHLVVESLTAPFAGLAAVLMTFHLRGD